MRTFRNRILAGLALVLLPGNALAEVRHAEVARPAPDQLRLTWEDANPVDIYLGDRPDAAITGRKPVATHSTAGTFTLDHADTARRYFTLVDTRDHRPVEVAERLVPLAQGSNFRDIGGYVGAGGRHVRWGLIYRSAGQPLLTPADVAIIHDLHVAQLVDLRSSEERVIAPTRITGIPYAAVGYAMADLMRGANGQPVHNGADIYRAFPLLLAPQLKIVFAHLLHEKTPIVYNCSAGQGSSRRWCCRRWACLMKRSPPGVRDGADRSGAGRQRSRRRHVRADAAEPAVERAPAAEGQGRPSVPRWRLRRNQGQVGLGGRLSGAGSGCRPGADRRVAQG